MHKALEELEKPKIAFRNPEREKLTNFSQLDTVKPEERAIVQRWKQHLPSFVAVRRIAMTAAALDPLSRCVDSLYTSIPLINSAPFEKFVTNNLSPEAEKKDAKRPVRECYCYQRMNSIESNF